MGDIDTVVVESLKTLDLERPIREVDIVIHLSASEPARTWLRAGEIAQVAPGTDPSAGTVQTMTSKATEDC